MACRTSTAGTRCPSARFRKARWSTTSKRCPGTAGSSCAPPGRRPSSSAKANARSGSSHPGSSTRSSRPEGRPDVPEAETVEAETTEVLTMARKPMGGLAKAARRKLRKRAGLVETRRKKEFTYRGYTLDEMKAMTLEEIIELLPARPRRSVIRGIDDERYRFIEKLRANGTEVAVRTHCRDVPILPDFIGKKVAIHNGKEFVTVEIKPEMI